MNSIKNIENAKYFGITLDPLHIGSGGYRLGGVDNTIVRDPTTDVPKIPGTSIAGAVREYYTLDFMDKENKTRKEAEDEVKQVFGDDQKQGMMRFYDGQIVFFPVSSIQGTIWITTLDILEYWFCNLGIDQENRELLINKINKKAISLEGINTSNTVNFGWLLLEIEDSNNFTEEKIKEIKNASDNFTEKIAIVSDKLFSIIVNDNLEVRTSVRIDPNTGAAAEGALFTYEAIPRGTVIGFEFILDKHQSNNLSLSKIIDGIIPYLRLLGLGGLVTRGFGRINLIKKGE